MLKIGILGASGFIGNRAVEMLQARGYKVRPIVRTSASIARLTRSDLDCHIANALDHSALERAFSGCDIVIHSVLGSPGLIRGTVSPTYKAASKAGVRRLIYLSTMCVHSQAPAPGTNEESHLSDHQPFPYNSAKIYAEGKLLQMRKKGTVEVVIFRPGIVFGPRSRWIFRLADELLQGTAYLVNEGKGICNTVYVDNLIHAMHLAMIADNVDGEAFFIGEQELVTWADFYYPIAEALGIDLAQIHCVSAPQFTRSWKKRILEPIWDSTVVQKVLSLLSDPLKQTIKRAIPRRKKSSTPLSQSSSIKPQLIVTPEMAALQQCQYKLPLEKAEKILSYKPIVSFPEACDRCIDWLASEGYSANCHYMNR